MHKLVSSSHLSLLLPLPRACTQPLQSPCLLCPSCRLLAGYGVAIAPFTYLCSYVVQKPTRAQIYVVLFNIFLGQMLMIAQCV